MKNLHLNRILLTLNQNYLVGILIDEKLTFKSHITHLESKLSRSVGIIVRLRHYLPISFLLTIYYALIQSQLLYGLPIWASTYQTYLTKLRKLQNKAVKILAKAHPRESPWYHKLNILKLDNLYQSEIAKSMYQYIHNKLPHCFCNYFANLSDSHHHTIRNSSTHNLQLPRFSTFKTQKSSKFVGAKIWNNIPDDIKKLCYGKFKIAFKNILLKRYASHE